MLAGALTPIILKKELAELEWLSFVLFGAIGIFILVNFYQLEFQNGFNATFYSHEMIAPNPSIVRFISAISVTLVAYSY